MFSSSCRKQVLGERRGNAIGRPTKGAATSTAIFTSAFLARLSSERLSFEVEHQADAIEWAF
jgi:hypothetical protein